MSRITWRRWALFVAAGALESGYPLFAATSADAVSGGYYGPSGRFGLVGPTGAARIPKRALDADVAAHLRQVAESLTGVTLPSP